jgi:hypothetical protein
MSLFDMISMRMYLAAAVIDVRAGSVIVGLLDSVWSRPAVWARRRSKAVKQGYSFTSATRRGGWCRDEVESCLDCDLSCWSARARRGNGVCRVC